MAILQDRINTLDTENSGKAARINDLQRQLDSANTLATKYEADMQVFVRQLEVQLAQIQELTTKVDEHRAKLVKSLNEKSLAVAELQYARQLAERLQQDLGQLEEKHVEMARDKKHLEEKINAIALNSIQFNLARILGPTIGGLAYTTLGATWCFKLRIGGGLWQMKGLPQGLVDVSLHVEPADRWTGNSGGQLRSNPF